MTNLTVTGELGPVAEALGTAIGVLRPAASGLELDAGFFAAPGERIGRMLADPEQRAATVRAMALLVPPDDIDGVAHHRLVDTGGVTVSITTVDAGGSVVVGLALVLPAESGTLELAVPLVSGSGSRVTAVAGTDEHPVTVTLSSHAADGTGLAVRAGLAGPDLAADSTVTVVVSPAGADPVTLDPAAGTAPGDAIRALISPLAGPPLAGVLGLSGGVPPLPLAPSTDASSAWRGWLSDLLTGPEPPVLQWSADLLALLDGRPLPAGSPAPAPGEPLDLTLRRPGGSAPGFGLRIGVEDGPRATAAVRTWFDGPAGTLTAEAALAGIPLAGTAPATVGGSCSVTVTTPGRLWPPADGHDTELRVGTLVAGLAHGPAGVVPVLALGDVHLALPGSGAVDVDHLDLTSADLVESVAGALADVVAGGLGRSVPATALLRLLGLAPPPGVPPVDAGLLATQPGRALTDWYAALRESPTGWAPVAACGWALLGGAPPGDDLDAVVVSGAGTSADPWRVPLDHLPAGSFAEPMALCVWDGGVAGGPPRLCAGLRVAATVTVAPGAPAVEADLLVELLGVDVAPAGAAAPRLLSSVHATVRTAPGALSPVGDTVLTLGPLEVAVSWTAGSPLTVRSTVGGVTAGDARLDAIEFPGPVPSSGEPDLGLADGNAAVLWTVARTLVGAAASAIGGAGRLATVLAGARDGPPPVDLPDPDDVRSGVGDPAGLVGGWLTGIAVDESGVSAAGRPHLLGLLAWLRALLTRRLTGAPGRSVDPAADDTGGSGTADTPWCTPLHEADQPAVELLTWISGDGPPTTWGPLASAVLFPVESRTYEAAGAVETGDEPVEAEELWAYGSGDTVPDGPDIVTAVQALSAAGGIDPRRLAGLSGGSIDRLASVLSDADGVLHAGAAAPPPGWATATPVPASHWDLVAHPDAAAVAAAHLRSAVEGADPAGWTLIAVDAGLTDPGDWNPLAEALGLGPPLPVTLRVPGVEPALVDLGGLTPSPAYVIDLGDAATATSSELAGRLAHAVDGIRAARGVDRVILAAHSWAGLVACDWVRAAPAGVLGLVTLGTPFSDPTVDDDAGGAPGPAGVLVDPDLAGTVHAVRALFADPSVLGPHGYVLRRLAGTVTGWRTGAPGEPPVPREPLTPMLARAGEDRATPPEVPALAVRGALPGDLRRDLGRALWRLGPAGSAPGPIRQGVRVGLDLGPAAADEASVALTVRLDTTSDGAAVEVGAELGSPAGWLVGGPLGGPERVRWAEFVARRDGTGTRLDLLMYDTAQAGVTAPVVGLADPTGPALAAAVLTELGVQAERGGRAGVLVELLTALDLVAGAGADLALLPDGIAMLQDDRAFGGVLAAVLDRPGGAAGLRRDTGSPDGRGPWRYHHPALPVELVVTPADVTVTTTGAGLPAGQDGLLTGTARVTLPEEPTGRIGWELTAGDTVLTKEADGGAVRLRGPGLEPAATLLPPDPDLLDRLAGPAARTFAAAALGAGLGLARGGGPMPWLGGFLRDPGAELSRRLGGDGAGPPDAGMVGALLTELGALVGGGGPLTLPGGLALYARAGPGGTLRIGLAGDGPLELAGQGAAATTLDADLWLDVDATRTATPGGTLRLHLPLPDGPWEAVDVILGAGPDGATLAVTPGALGATIGLLPAVSGLDALLGGGARLLLAAVLDELADRLPDSPARTAALGVAAAFGLYDPVTGRFDSARLAGLGTDLTGAPPDLPTARRRADALAAVARLLAPAATASSVDGVAQLTATLGGGGRLTIGTGLATGPATVRAELAGAVAGAASLDLDVSAAGSSLSLAGALDLGRGMVLRPLLTAESLPSQQAGTVTVDLLADATVVLPLAPHPVPPTAAQQRRLATHLAVPLAVRALLDTAHLEDPLWSGGPHAGDLLVAAGLARRRGGILTVAATPDLATVLGGPLRLVAGASVPIVEGLELALTRDGTRYGPSLRGTLALNAGGPPVTLHLGMPAEVPTDWDGADAGVAVLLVDVPTGGIPALAPLLRLAGTGFAVTGEHGALVDTPLVTIRTAGLFGLVDVDLDGRVRPAGPVHGALQLLALGLPLLPSEGGDNPVAASLLAATGGDPTPASPPVDLTLASGDDGWTVRFAGEPALRLPVQQGFGPLYLDEVALSYESVAHRIGVGVSGDVSVGPLIIGLDDLTVRVPLATAGDPASWLVDLAGLAVALASDVIEVSGGLKKLPLPGGDVEYLGALSVTLAGRNLTAVGSYSQPHDELGEYTSLFVFLNVPIPLGGPPFFFVLGLAAGVGYNRRLLVPDDPAEVPAFPLVAAVSGDLGLGDDPVAGLRAIGADLSPARGAYWGAAGVRFTTFGLIQGTALAYVSLDTGVEIGLLGLLQLALPSAGAGTVLSVELGLAASYSTIDRIISVRAGLTAGSWLFSEDCRLTGGFAFMAWLATPEVLLSIGGYHPRFTVPDHYPEVDPVGFEWIPGSGVSVKGETYFALTHSAAMLGGSLEASYDRGTVRAWFETSVDVMVTWDPFTYRADLHVGVGASLTIQACVFVCVRVRMSVDVGADLHIAGPPLRAVAGVDLGVTSITVAFGDEVPQPWLSWAEVSRTYLGGGRDDQPATVTSVTAGRLESTAATAPDGSEAEPWVVGTTFTLVVDSAMPCTGLKIEDSAAGEHRPAGVVAPSDVDVVPAGPDLESVTAVLSVAISKRVVGDWEPATTDVVDSLEVTGRQGHFPAALWEQGRADEPAAAMLAAIGGSQLVAGLTVTERTGAFGDHATVPLSTLVEEQPTLPLPLGPAGGPTWPGRIEPPVPKPVPGRRRTTQPRLLGVGRRRAAGTPWSGRGAPRDDQRRDGDTSAVRLDPGAAAVWDVRDLRFADLALDREGGGLRLIALTAGGRPLVDRAVPADADLAALLPPRTARVALLPAGDADPEQDRAAGWRLRDELIRVGPGTFLAGDAVVLTATPVPPAGRYPGAVATVPAVSVLAGQPATTTVVHSPGNVLVVKCSAGADPVIDVRGGEAGRLRRVPAADGALLVVPIRRAAGPLRVRVSGTGTAAVLIVDGGAQAWVDRLTGRPGLPRPGGTGGSAVRVNLRSRIPGGRPT
ncbi:DUF6603 domain-containing protein [Micromonospora arida]|uniref:DUF6603 domain-containing protein n=1 Tax=Micromonospora arida TaxID=2203715 RepID=UPI003CEC7F7C